MPEMSLIELKASLPRGGRLLGLDLGSKTIGVATSDRTRMIATPIAGMTVAMRRLSEGALDTEIPGRDRRDDDELGEVEQEAQLDGLQVAVQRLLVQPMWGATQLLGCRFEPVSHQFVNFDADGGGGHIRVAPWKNLCTLFVKWRDSRKVQPSQILGFTCLCFGATE